jgi:hypothetical protein
MERVVIFDVLGTLFSLDAVRTKLSELGAPPATVEAWFERTLHSALTLTTIGEFRPFRENRPSGAADDARATRTGGRQRGGDPGRPQRREAGG